MQDENRYWFRYALPTMRLKLKKKYTPAVTVRLAASPQSHYDGECNYYSSSGSDDSVGKRWKPNGKWMQLLSSACLGYINLMRIQTAALLLTMQGDKHGEGEREPRCRLVRVGHYTHTAIVVRNWERSYLLILPLKLYICVSMKLNKLFSCIHIPHA